MTVVNGNSADVGMVHLKISKKNGEAEEREMCMNVMCCMPTHDSYL